VVDDISVHKSSTWRSGYLVKPSSISVHAPEIEVMRLWLFFFRAAEVVEKKRNIDLLAAFSERESLETTMVFWSAYSMALGWPRGKG
jgi:hypothetical protein